MCNSETVRQTYKRIGFGKGSIRDEKFEFVIRREVFNTVGDKLKKHLGDRAVDFRLTMQMFELQCTALTDLNPFLILEEISILIEETQELYPSISGLLRQIYRAFKHQTYSEGVVVACLIR